MSDPRRNKKTDKNGRRGQAPRPAQVPEEIEVHSEDEIEIESPEDSISDILKDREEILDKYQRLAAEFDNYRKRQARDFNRLIQQGRRKLIEELLVVLDNFDRARITCQGDHSDKEIVDGILQTSDQLHSVLKREGLEEVPTKSGDAFDPNIHEAMVAEEMKEGEVDIVLEVFQKGYYFGNDLLRPVRVKVGKVPAQNGAGVS